MPQSQTSLSIAFSSRSSIPRGLSSLLAKLAAMSGVGSSSTSALTATQWFPVGSPSSDGEIIDSPLKLPGTIAVSLSVSPTFTPLKAKSKSALVPPSTSSSVQDPLGAYSLSGLRSSQRRRVKRPSGKGRGSASSKWRASWAARPSPVVGLRAIATKISKTIVGWRGVLADRYGLFLPKPTPSAIVGSKPPKSAIVGGSGLIVGRTSNMET